MLPALEMWLWSFLWVFLGRVVQRMLRNAKVDLVQEVVILAVEALKRWNLTRDQVAAITTAAYDGKTDEIQLLLPNLTPPAASGPPATTPPGAPNLPAPARPAPAGVNSPSNPSDPEAPGGGSAPVSGGNGPGPRG